MLVNADLTYHNRSKELVRAIGMYAFESNKGQLDENSVRYKIRRMAIEIITSSINDILTVKRLKKYCQIMVNQKTAYSKKVFAQFMINNHVSSVNWFCSGEALNSIWFRILDLEDSGISRMTKLVHNKIENG